MAKKAITQLKAGDKLIEDVHTQLGNVLFYKEKIISDREIEILTAFLIPFVNVHADPNDKQSAEQKKESSETAAPSYTPFQLEYERMVLYLKKVFPAMSSGVQFPILELRTKLEGLLSHIDQYNPISFAPIKFNSEDYLYHNGLMVGLTSYKLALWQGLAQKDWVQVAMAGLFHDIGNMNIDPAILSKTTALTPEELDEIKKHTIIGYNILKNIAGINEGVKFAALQHHEKEDGSGYPLGVKGDKIHTYAKIVSVSDIYHAMSMNRKYKKALSPYLVLEQLYAEAFGKLDPAVVQTFIHKITQFSNGTLVMLSNNEIGEIVFSERNHPTRPWINVNGKIVNLVTERNLYITKIIQA
jgi:HD-GYP domain-containing protein (c-di-GMP phosphodiesterase class II)